MGEDPKAFLRRMSAEARAAQAAPAEHHQPQPPPGADLQH